MSKKKDGRIGNDGEIQIRCPSCDRWISPKFTRLRPYDADPGANVVDQSATCKHCNILIRSLYQVPRHASLGTIDADLGYVSVGFNPEYGVNLTLVIPFDPVPAAEIICRQFHGPSLAAIIDHLKYLSKTF